MHTLHTVDNTNALFHSGIGGFWMIYFLYHTFLDKANNIDKIFEIKWNKLLLVSQQYPDTNDSSFSASPSVCYRELSSMGQETWVTPTDN